MNHNMVTELLKNYRSYRYAANNYKRPESGQRIQMYVNSDRYYSIDEWDHTRYSRIVSMIDGAVAEVLSDDQRTVIMRKYLDRNTLTISEIADAIHKDRTTVSRWHKTALKKLAIALEPLTVEEINNIDHMFDQSWQFKEQKSA